MSAYSLRGWGMVALEHAMKCLPSLQQRWMKCKIAQGSGSHKRSQGLKEDGALRAEQCTKREDGV